MRLTKVLSVSVVLVFAAGTAATLRADGIPFGVTANVTVVFDTNGIYGGGGCADPNYPNCSTTNANSGLTLASAIATDSGTTGPNTNPAGTTSSAFASVTASEGHIGLSFSASAEGIGFSGGSGGASWNDVLTVGSGDLDVGTPVNLVANVGLDAEMLGSGSGADTVQACFTVGYYVNDLCTFGSKSGESGEPNLGQPVAQTQVFTAYVGETIPISGSANGSASADALTGGEDANWSLVATNSAHFFIQSLTPGVDLTTASGCSITSSYGCTPPTGTVPEPPSLVLLLTGGLGLASLAWTDRRRRAVTE